MSGHDVLIIGAGPTGLALALFLTRQDVRVRIIAASPGPVTESRAMAVHARTLEFYRQFGLAEKAVALGIKAERARICVDGVEKAHLDLLDAGQGLSAFPYILVLAQDVHERFLLEELAELGVTVAWNTVLVDVDAGPDDVVATVEHVGTQSRIKTPWLVGCDGGHSATREALGLSFEGGQTEGLFFVADVDTDLPSTDLQVGVGPETFALMLPVRTLGTQRLIGVVPPALAAGEVRFEDVGPGLAGLLGATVTKVQWFSTYRVRHRVAEHFRVGRCFLAGDAGHVHSPVGGQGMNTGIGDAMNLAWKLAGVVNGSLGPSVLESYEPERIAFARELVASADQAFGWVVHPGMVSNALRRLILPAAMSVFGAFAWTRHEVFLTISQTRINYRDSALSVGEVGSLAGGDRLPWVAELDGHWGELHADWHVIAFQPLVEATARLAADRGLRVDILPWSEATRAAGYEKDGVYLVRPDGHLALAARREDEQALPTWVGNHALVIG